jgi:uncharacterized protein DUF4166
VVAVITRHTPAATTTEPSILGHLLGAGTAGLPGAVLRFHASSHDSFGTGTFEVEQAKSRAGRVVARAMRLPRATGLTAVTLSICRGAHADDCLAESWRRTFDDEVLASSLTTDGQHLLERIGAIELCFTLDVGGQRVRFRHVGTRLRIGSLRVRIPLAMSPTIAASVGAIGGRIDVSVRISAPILGTLLHYAGQLTSSEQT